MQWAYTDKSDDTHHSLMQFDLCPEYYRIYSRERWRYNCNVENGNKVIANSAFHAAICD